MCELQNHNELETFVKIWNEYFYLLLVQNQFYQFPSNWCKTKTDDFKTKGDFLTAGWWEESVSDQTRAKDYIDTCLER